MEPVFEFPSEAERREDAEEGTRFSKDDKEWAAQMNMTYFTLSRTLNRPTVALHTNMSDINHSLTSENFHTYLQESSMDDIKSDLKAFQDEAEILTQATQEVFKKDKEWKRGTEMVVSGSSALTGVMLAIGIVPDDMHEGIRGEEPIKRKMFPLLGRVYQLRVDIETKNLIIRKCQLEILKSVVTRKNSAATSVPVDTTVLNGTSQSCYLTLSPRSLPKRICSPSLELFSEDVA